MKSKIEFTNLDLKKLIVPLIIEQALVVSVGIADTMMVSAVGEAAVSGVSLVDMISVLLINIFAALATGGAVVTSQFIGAQQRDKACLSANQLLIITLSVSVVIMLFSITMRAQLLRLLFGSIDVAVMENAMVYFWISALSFPFLALYNSCAALFRAMGNSRVSMFASVITNAINIGGNAICVYGLRMGVAGVAVPTLIARAAGAAILLILLRDPRRMVCIKLKNFIPDFGMIRRILFIGIPSGLENSIFQLGRVMVTSIITVFGTMQIAATAVAHNMGAFGNLPGQAMSLAMITVIGHCIGACDFEGAKYYTKKLMKITYVLTISINLIIIVLLPLLLRIYNLSDETLRLATILVLIHSGCAIFFWPVSFALPNALRAANDVKFTMVVSIASMWVFRVLFSYILGLYMGWGAIGVWISMVLDWICRLSFFITRFRSGKWQTKYKPSNIKI
jgi:putative MATE family efflux protein